MIFIKIYGNSLARNSRESFFRLVFLLLKNANEFCLAYQWKEKQYRKVRVGTVALPALKTINPIWFTSIKTANVLLFFRLFHDCLLPAFMFRFMTSEKESGLGTEENFIFIWCDFLWLRCRLPSWGLGWKQKHFLPLSRITIGHGRRFHSLHAEFRSFNLVKNSNCSVISRHDRKKMRTFDAITFNSFAFRGKSNFHSIRQRGDA